MPRVSPLVLIPPLAFAALAGLFLGGLWFRTADGELPSALVGQAAPAPPEATLAGFPGIPADALTDGRPKLVNFFASWCAPCRVEHPVLKSLAGEGIPIYGIAYKDQPSQTSAFLTELGNPYAGIGTDEGGRVAPNWGLYGVPETFVLAGDGTVIDRMPMPLTPELVESRLRPALARAAGTAD